MRLVLLLVLFAATSANGEIYMWKDSRGTAHYTNQPDTVPPKYKNRVKVLEMPGEQKKEQGQQTPGSSVSLPVPPPPPAAGASPPAAGTSRPAARQEGAAPNAKRRRMSEE